MEDSPWKTVKGKSFTPYELARFTEAQFITFLRFCEQFMVPTENGSTYSNTKALWLRAEEILGMPNHPFHEYLWRINFFSSDEGSSYRKFFAKNLLLMRSMLKFLQHNPALVTDQMKEIMEKHPFFARYLKQTAIVPTALGMDVVVQKQNTASLDEQLYTVGLKTINMLEKLVESISDKDMKSMKARDKMIAIGRMGYIYTIAKNLKPNKQIFNQINIHAADREALETSLLAFSRKE